jgi:hypothetical protein
MKCKKLFVDISKTSGSIIVYSVHLQYSMFPKLIFYFIPYCSELRYDVPHVEEMCVLVRVGVGV